MGKPKHGPVCELMRKTRYILNICLNSVNNAKIWLEQMPWLNPCKLKMQTVFGKNVSKTYKKGIPNATNVNGANDPTAIYVENTFWIVVKQCNHRCKYAKCERVCTKHRLCYGNNLLITPCMVQNAIDKLKSGKACGNDGLSAEHFIHSDRRITILLSIFYNRVISHGHLPDDFMKTIIIPLIQK